MAVVLLLSQGCLRRKLHLETSSARLELTVENTRASGEQVEAGERYQVRVYGEDGIYRNSTFVSPTGGNVFLPRGTYNVLASRFDSPTVILDGDGRYGTLRAYTRDASSNSRAMFNRLASEVMAKSPELVNADGKVWEEFLTGPVAWEPGWFFSGKADNLEVPVRSTDDAIFVFQIRATTVVRPCTLTVRGLKGLTNIGAVTCFLTGLSRGVYLGTGEPDLEPVTITFDLPISKNATEQKTEFRTFGFVPNAVERARSRGIAPSRNSYPNTRNILFLLITDIAGGNYLFTFDVTDQCTVEDGEISLDKTTDIVVDMDFTVPHPSHGGGGLAPTTEDWELVIHEIHI